MRKIPKFTYDGNDIEIVWEYKYLGILFNYNGSFLKHIKAQSEKAERAMFQLVREGKKLNLEIDTMLHLFDSTVVQILLYGAEVWGY